ncbi:hypothetical protein UlMin_016237 [Ulmus minor]
MELKLQLFSSRKWFSGFKGSSSSDHQSNLDGNVSSGKKPFTDSRASSSKKVMKKLPVICSRADVFSESSKGKKAVLWGREVEELNERLRILEAETEAMKEAFFWSMEERKNMMNEIYQQFQLLHRCVHPKNQVIAESSSFKAFEDGRNKSNLPEILNLDPNPTLVIRDLRPDKPH